MGVLNALETTLRYQPEPQTSQQALLNKGLKLMLLHVTSASAVLKAYQSIMFNCKLSTNPNVYRVSSQ